MRNNCVSHLHRLLLTAMAGALMLAPSPAASDSGVPEVEIVSGVQTLDIDGDRAARAEEYRDLYSGSRLEGFALNWLDAADGWDMSLRGNNILQLDQRYALRLSSPGEVSVRADWRETPHVFGGGGTLLHKFEGDIFTFDSAFRQVLENAATDPAAAVPLATLMPQVLTSTGREIATGLIRKQGSVEASGRVAPGVRVGVNAGSERVDGSRALAVGTYIRRQAVSGEANTGAGYFDRERFVPRGIELPAPIRYRTSVYGLSASVKRDRAFVDAGWQTSRFKNGLGTLRWDNPFEGGSSVASSADRGRFAHAAMDLYPNNDHDRIHLTGGVSLPKRTRINATFAVATTKQNDPFMAFTTNEALMFPGADRVLGTADDVVGTSASLLPAASLDGEIKTTRTDLRITSHPTAALALNAAVRSYKYENNAAELFFPGYAAYGESYWRAGVGRRIAGRDTLYSESAGYEKTVLSAGAGYALLPGLHVDVEYSTSKMEYDLRQVDETTEDVWQFGMRFEPLDWASGRLGYLVSSREFAGEYEIGLETSRVRMFDVWARDRDRVQADISLVPDDRWSVDLAFSDGKDEYPGVVTDPDPLPATGNIFASQPYGLNESGARSLSAGVGYRFDAVSLSAAFGHDTSKWSSLAVTKTTLADDGVQFDPDNRWSREQEDTNDWVTLAATIYAVPRRTTLLADLTWSHYEGEMKTANLSTPDLNSAVAYDFPVFKTDLASARLGIKHAIRENIDLVANYWFEPFRLDDWQSDSMQPYMQGVVQETAGSATDFRSEDMSRYLFLDSRYSDYTVNAASLMLSMRF